MPHRNKGPELVLLATRNQGKVREFARLLAPLGLEVTGLDSFPELGETPETGASFLENALLKAGRAAAAARLVALADDSGLLVDALGGRPGIYSARFSLEGGENSAAQGASLDSDNNAKLLALLEGLPQERRAARFHCALAAVSPEGLSIHAEACWPGLILTAPRGERGFGYDPLFFDPELGLSAAEMPPDLKNRRSHRARAAQALLELWPAFLAKVSAT